MSKKTALGIDCGGTATRWLVVDTDGHTRGNGSDQGATGHVFAAEAREHTRSVLRRICVEITRQGLKPAAVTAGVTGLTNTSKETVTIGEWLATDLNLPSSAVKIVDDMWIAFHTVFEPGNGVVVYSGTGAVGTHIDATGTIRKTGAHGHIIDDGGSAYWIGQRAIRWLMRSWDEQDGQPSGALAEALFAAMGGNDWEHIRTFIYQEPRSHVAQLARATAAAANRSAPEALLILNDAGTELARLANVLAGRLAAQPVALIGGTARLHPTIQAAFLDRLDKSRIALRSDGGVDLRKAHRTPVEAAAQLATDRIGK